MHLKRIEYSVLILSCGCPNASRGDTEESDTKGGKRTIDLQKPFFLLHVLRNIDLVDIVLQAQLLERAANLLTVRCASRVPTIMAYHVNDFVSGRQKRMLQGWQA